MKKLFISVILVIIAVTTYTQVTTKALVYNYWAGNSIRSEFRKHEYNGVSHSYTFCSRWDFKRKSWAESTKFKGCSERAVTEHQMFVNIKTKVTSFDKNTNMNVTKQIVKKISKSIFVGYQHGKQDMFFDNLREALKYVFATKTNKAHFARDIHGQLLYFDAYGLQLGDHNQRNQWYGKFEKVWKKVSNKWMYRNGNYFLCDRSIRIGNKTYKFEHNGFLIGRR